MPARASEARVQSVSAELSTDSVHVQSDEIECDNTPPPCERAICDTIKSNSCSSLSTPVSNNKTDHYVNIRPFSFLLWNVNGLFSKLKNADFCSYVSSFDFVCFVETWLDEYDCDIFNEHKPFYDPAFKLSKHGRRSGGVVCLIKKELIPFVKKIDVNYPNVCVFVIDKTLFGTLKDILYICTYVQPQGSRFILILTLTMGFVYLKSA